MHVGGHPTPEYTGVEMGIDAVTVLAEAALASADQVVDALILAKDVYSELSNSNHQRPDNSWYDEEFI